MRIEYIRDNTGKEKLVEETQFSSCMERIKSGDKEALHDIYQAYIGYIYSVVLGVVQNKEDAEDVTSEFFIKLWKLADTYQGGNGHKAWLATIARNMAIDLIRKNKKVVLTDDFVDTMAENASDECIEDDVISDMSLKNVLETLKPNEREVINLKIMGELTFQEIANVLKVPLGTITWRYQNALKKLRRCGYE